MNKEERNSYRVDSSVTKASLPNNQLLLVESTNSKCVQCFILAGVSIHNMVMHNPMRTFYMYVDNVASNWLVKKVTINCF